MVNSARPKLAPPSSAPSAVRYQFRVGHGGFHATVVNAPQPGEAPLTYVYDVGATPSKPLLLKAIGYFLNELRAHDIWHVDYVFLSHIDEDHVNGFQELLDALSEAGLTVGHVVMPWLSPVESLLSLSRSVHRGERSAVVNLAASHPSVDQYVESLGAEGVIRVREEEAQYSDLDDNPTQTLSGNAVVMSGSNMAGTSASPWQLVPIRVAPPWPALRQFRQQVLDHTRLDPNDFGTHEDLLRQHRTVLRSAIRAAAKSTPGLYGSDVTNASSMALYAGGDVELTQCRTLGGASGIQLACTHPWLHTGDLPLANPDLWTCFVSRTHSAGLDLPVCVLVAPHHGSGHSHQPLLLALTTPSVVALTTGKTRSGAYAKRVNPSAANHDAAAIGSTVVELFN